MAQVANAYGEMYQVPEAQREQFMGEFRPMAERLPAHDRKGALELLVAALGDVAKRP